MQKKLTWGQEQMMKEIKSVELITVFPDNFNEKEITNVQNKTWKFWMWWEPKVNQIFSIKPVMEFKY